MLLRFFGRVGEWASGRLDGVCRGVLGVVVRLPKRARADDGPFVAGGAVRTDRSGAEGDGRGYSGDATVTEDPRNLARWPRNGLALVGQGRHASLSAGSIAAGLSQRDAVLDALRDEEAEVSGYAMARSNHGGLHWR
jgi:hypothetical protein